MKPTRVSTLVWLFVAVAVGAWGVLRLADRRGSVLPQITWTAPVLIGLLGVVVVIAAFALRARLRGGPGVRPPQPLGVARMAVLGKASSHVGAIVAGLYTGWALVLLPSLEIEARRDRAIVTVVAVLASLLLTGAGLFLERICRIRPPGADQPPPAVPTP